MDINKDLVRRVLAKHYHPTPAASINRQPHNSATIHGYHTGYGIKGLSTSR